MKTIVCKKPGRFEMSDMKAPSPAYGEVLLDIQAVGICGTDLHAYAGNQPFFTYPRILGHELSATVRACHVDGADLREGDKVAIIPYLSCGSCVACRQGKTNCCSSLKVLGVHIDGGMQEQITIPGSLVIPVNHLMHREIAIIEPLSIGAHSVERSVVTGNDTVVVTGCGPIGLGIIKFASGKGARVIAVDLLTHRLETAKKFGASDTVLANKEPVHVIREITGGDMARVAFDATGNKIAMEGQIDLVSHGGKYILVGLTKNDLSFYHPKLHAKEMSILCSRNATRSDFETVIKMLSDGDFPLAAYITHRVSFDGMIDQFDSWLDRDNQVIKAMVEL